MPSLNRCVYFGVRYSPSERGSCQTRTEGLFAVLKDFSRIVPPALRPKPQYGQNRKESYECGLLGRVDLVTGHKSVGLDL